MGFVLLNSRIVLAAEKFALRQQLADPRQSAKRPKLRPPDGLFWVVLFGLSKGWHREVIELFWRWKSRLTCPISDASHHVSVCSCSERAGRRRGVAPESGALDMDERLGVQVPYGVCRRQP
jgi:hypothetical protein